MLHIIYKYTHKRNLFFLIVAAIFLLFAPAAYTVMPPEVYAARAKASKIKAIAIVKDIEIATTGDRYNSKMVTFWLEYANTINTPEFFTGLCKSIDTPLQQKNIMVGDDIYHYPNIEDRVYVTVSEDGGYITTMTNMTPELEDAFRNDPIRIIYKFGKAYAQEKGALPILTPVIRGKEPTPEDQISAMSILDDLGKDQKIVSQSYGHGDLETIIPPTEPKQSVQDIQGQFIKRKE